MNPREIKNQLLEQTRTLPKDSFFVEHSRQRELDYIERSVSRWLEILGIAKARIPNLKEASCLDIGSSPFTLLLKDHLHTVTALDLSDSFRSRCEQAGVSFIEGGVNSPEAIARIPRVDCIFFLEVLEHLHSSPVEVLKALRPHLKPGGLLILTTPNMMCFKNRINMLLNRKLAHFDYPPFAVTDKAHGFTHDRIYMPKELKEYAEAAGYNQVELLYQLHVNDSAQEGRSLPQRIASIVPRTFKQILPSVRDGIIIAARA